MNLFCNIYYVHLCYVDGIKHLSGLSNIKLLEVSNSHFTSIDFIPGLRRLTLVNVKNLIEISQSYESLPELKIHECPTLNVQGFGNHTVTKFQYLIQMK